MRQAFSLFILLLTGCLQPCLLYAQTSLSGKVVDAEGSPLPYISVQLLRADSTFVMGAATDTLGNYLFAKITPSCYLLTFSSIGYKRVTIPANVSTISSKLELPLVRMATDNVVLSEVVVKGASLIRQKDRILILPDKQQAKHGGTGYDLLYNLMIPGIEVDRINGKVKTFGGEATLYIDGRKADFREVQSLRPRDIEKVEYFDVPTGKYGNDIAAINYITRKYKAGGYVALDARQTIGYLNGDYNAVSKISHGNMSYTLFAGYSMNKYDGEMNDIQENFTFSEYDINRKTTTLENKVKNNNQYVQLFLSHLNEQHNLAGRISFVRNDAPDNHSKEMLEYSKGYALNQESNRMINQQGKMPSVDLYGYFNLKNHQYVETSLSGSFTNSSYLYTYQEKDYSILSHTKEDIYDIHADIKYGIQWKERNALSVQASHYHGVTSSQYGGSNPSWKHLWTSETILFTEYNRTFGEKLTLKIAPGLSFLQYHLHGADRIRQINPRLRANLMYRFSKQQQITFDGYFGNTSPNILGLSDAVQEVDALTIKKGNSQLKNCHFGEVKLSYSGQFDNFGLYAIGNYSIADRLNTNDAYIENGKLVKSYRSDINAHFANVLLSLSWKASEHLRLKMDGYWIYSSFFKGISDKQNSISGMVQLDYYWKNLSCSLYGKTGVTTMEAELIRTYEPEKYGITAHWSSGNWLVEVGAESPFTKHRRWKYSMNWDEYNYTSYATGRTYQRTGYVKVIYTLDFGKKTSRDSNNVNRNINNAILKAD